MNLPDDHKIVIHSRDYVTTRINVNQLKTIVSDINKGSLNVIGMKTFVTDSLGLTTTAEAKQVQDQLYFMLRMDKEELNRKLREQIRKAREEQAHFKQKQRIERNIKMKEKIGKLILKIKRIIPKRKSK